MRKHFTGICLSYKFADWCRKKQDIWGEMGDDEIDDKMGDDTNPNDKVFSQLCWRVVLLDKLAKGDICECPHGIRSWTAW